MGNKFLPARFLSLRATVPALSTWEDIVQELAGTRHAAITALYRSLETDKNGGTEDSKHRQNQIKQNQPAFIPSVFLEGGRSAKHIKGYSGFIMVDIDDIPEKSFDEILDRVKSDPYAFLTYKTLSGKGIRVITGMAGEVTKENFAVAWKTANDYYANLTGIAIDRQCKNATRMSVICHDPDTLYRPDAKRMEFSAEKAKEQHKDSKRHRSGRKASAKRAENIVCRISLRSAPPATTSSSSPMIQATAAGCRLRLRRSIIPGPPRSPTKGCMPKPSICSTRDSVTGSKIMRSKN